MREPLIYLAIAVVLFGWRVWKESASVVVSLWVAASYIAVRIDHSSGKKRSSSALFRYDTPPVPPVPRL